MTFGDPFGALLAPEVRSTAVPEAAPGGMTVSELLSQIGGQIARSYGDIIVRGEIRSVKAAASGHVYFELKDPRDASLLNCVIFRSHVERLSFVPRQGDLVDARGALSVYAPHGKLSLNVRFMQPAGAGALYAQYLALKAQLESEGLFEASLKKELPEFARTVGIVTSAEGAAVRDAIKTIRSVAPWVSILVYPTLVQGAGCEEAIVGQLRAANARNEVDVLLLVRGGGSIADLWGFNAECIARQLRGMRMPVITGIGHESDITIADLAADARAATPTAAAALAVRGWVGIHDRLDSLGERFSTAAARTLALARARLVSSDRLRLILQSRLAHARAALQSCENLTDRVESALQERARRVDEIGFTLAADMRRCTGHAELNLARLSGRLTRSRPDTAGASVRVNAIQERLRRLAHTRTALADERLGGLAARLQALSPRGVLSRGYSYTTDAEGRIVRDAANLTPGQTVDVHFSRGSAQARILGKK